MTTITTSTAATATAYSNQRKVDRCQNGVLWAMFWDGTSTTSTSLDFSYSSDDGATWSAGTSTGFSGTGTTYTPNASFFIDLDDYAHVAYKDRADGFIYYRRGTPNAGRTAWTWSAATTVYSTTTNRDLPDIVAHREGTGWKAHIVATVSNNTSTQYYRLNITSAGAVSLDVSELFIGSYSGTVPTWPSIDFNHTGDGKTVAGGTPHLYAAWSAGATGVGKGIRFKKATYSGGTWTWDTEREIDSTSYAYSGGISSVFDGSRCVIVFADSGSTATVKVSERDASDTTTTTRTPTALSDGAVEALSVSYDGDADIHLWAVGATSADVKRIKYDRSAGTWDGSWTTVATADALADSLSLKRGYSDGLVEAVYTTGTGSPYNVTHQSVTLNTAPNAPTSLSPASSTTIDKDTTQRFSWTFSDPDTGDSQSQYDLQYKVVGAGSWTTVSGTTTNAYHDFAGGTFTAGDYEWQVRTYDAAGIVGPYSSSAFFTAATAPTGPTITAPISGGTVDTSPYTVTWSAPSQDAYQVRTVADLAGSPDTGTIYQDTGTVTSTSARSRSMTFDTTGHTEHVQVRVQVSGLWSTWASHSVSVSYTAPPTPTIVVTADDTNEHITVAVTNPAPTGSQPAVSSNEVFVRVATGGRADVDRTVAGDGIRIATGVANGGSYIDRAVASGVDYEYRVKAVGDNGVSTYSTWS